MGWRRAMFKGQKVWVEVDAEGGLKATGGRVPMRYSDKAGSKVYGAGASRVDGLEGPIVDLEAGVSADDAKGGTSKRRGSGFGSAGSRTKAQAAAAAEAAADLVASLPEGTAIAYTDGSCKGNPGPAGSGVRLELPDGRIAEASRSLGVATNNVAELTAIDIVLSLLDEAEVAVDAPVVVLSDSGYARGVLAQGWKAKANRELILGLRERLKARPGIELHWVAGHAGVAGNERADDLAGDGASGITKTTWR